MSFKYAIQSISQPHITINRPQDVCTDNFCVFLQSLQSDVVARELQRITADNNLLRRQIIASLEAADVTERKHTAAVRTLKVGISQSNMLTIAAGERTAAVELLCEGLKGRLAEVAHLQELYQKGIRAKSHQYLLICQRSCDIFRPGRLNA